MSSPANKLKRQRTLANPNHRTRKQRKKLYICTDLIEERLKVLEQLLSSVKFSKEDDDEPPPSAGVCMDCYTRPLIPATPALALHSVLVS